MKLQTKVLFSLAFSFIFGLGFLFLSSKSVQAAATDPVNVRVFLHDSTGNAITNATVGLVLGPVDNATTCNFAGKGSTWPGTYNLASRTYLFNNRAAQLQVCGNLQSYVITATAAGFLTASVNAYSQIHSNGGSTVIIDIELSQLSLSPIAESAGSSGTNGVTVSNGSAASPKAVLVVGIMGYSGANDNTISSATYKINGGSPLPLKLEETHNSDASCGGSLCGISFPDGFRMAYYYATLGNLAANTSIQVAVKGMATNPYPFTVLGSVYSNVDQTTPFVAQTGSNYKYDLLGIDPVSVNVSPGSVALAMGAAVPNSGQTITSFIIDPSCYPDHPLSNPPCGGTVDYRQVTGPAGTFNAVAAHYDPYSGVASSMAVPNITQVGCLANFGIPPAPSWPTGCPGMHLAEALNPAPTTTLRVSVFEDTNNNGKLDAGEVILFSEAGTTSLKLVQTGNPLTAVSATMMNYGDTGLTPGNYNIIITPDPAKLAMGCCYYVKTPSDSSYTSGGFTSPSSGSFQTGSVTIVADGTTFVNIAVKKIASSVLNVTVFNDDGSCAGDGIRNCGETQVPASMLSRLNLNLRLDSASASAIASSNPYSYVVPVGPHKLYISPFIVDPSQTSAWVVTEWNVGNAVGSNKPYNGPAPNFSTDSINVVKGVTTNVYLGVRLINFNIIANTAPKLILSPTSDPGNSDCATNSGCEVITLNLTWSPGWDPTTTYQVSSDCTSFVNGFSGQLLSVNSGVVADGATCPNISGTTTEPPTPLTKPGNGTSVNIKVSTTATGVGSILSTTFTVTGISSSTIQGITLTPKAVVPISFGYAAWLKTLAGDVGSRAVNSGSPGCPVNYSICASYLPSGENNAAHMVIVAQAVSNFTSAKNWLVSNYQPTDPLSVPAPNNFKSLSERFPDACPVSGTFDDTKVSPGRFIFKSDLVLRGAGPSLPNPSTAPSCGGKGIVSSTRSAAVIFVAGDLTIKQNQDFSLPTVFVVSGDITIKADVSSLNKAVFIADGSFFDGTVYPLTENVLNINGSVIAALGLGNPALHFQRDLGSATNKTSPAEILTLDPEFFWVLADYIGKSSSHLIEQTP